VAADSVRRIGPLVWIVLGVVVVAAPALGLLWMRSSPTPPFVHAELRPLQDLPDGAMKPAFSPTGDLLVAVMNDPETDVYSLWLVKPGAEAPLRLTTDIEVQGPSPVFSADGSEILFTSYRNDADLGNLPDTWTVPVLGGDPRRLLENAAGADVSPDGLRLVYSAVTDAGTAVVVRGAEGAEHVVAEPGFWPRWSPNGQWIAFTTSNPEGGAGEVFVIRPDGDDRRRLSTRPSQIYGLCWTRDSRWVVFGSDVEGASNLWVAPVNGGEPTRITRGPGESDSPSISYDGRRLAFSYGLSKSAIHLASSPGAPLIRIMSQEQAHALAISPDGGRLAVILGGLPRGFSLAVYDFETQSLRTVGGLDAESVAWMPDGRSLVVTAPAPNQDALWVWRVPLDGGLFEPLVRARNRWEWPDVSPDGDRLAGSRIVEGRSELVVVDLATGGEQVLDTAAERLAVRWSPDGAWIAWSSPPRPVDSEACGVWAIRVADGERRRVAADGSWAAWAGDDLIYARYGDNSGLWRVPVSGGSAERLYEPDRSMWNYFIYGLDIARGSSAMVVRLESAATALYVLEAPD
jgi:Tol biopolymer transport system component